MAIHNDKPDMSPAPNQLGKQLAKLIGNHTQAEIELSWKDSCPAELHSELYENAAKAVHELFNFCRDELGIILEGDIPNDTN